MKIEITVNQQLIKLFNRELEKLILELKSYQNETNLWITDMEVSNSAGNLSLHLVGNLNHFIGKTLGNTGYVRQRDLEFSDSDVSLNKIIDEISNTKEMVSKVLLNLSQDDLDKEYRRNPFEDPMTTQYFLFHLLTHLSYHLGQINYHRRLLDQ